MTGQAIARRPLVLLVDDNSADVRLVHELASEAGRLPVLDIAADGVEALARVRCEGPFAGHPPVDLILLDLNLPRCDGIEVLAELKHDEAFRHIPVIVLTTSSSPTDVNAAYAAGAAAFVTKPADIDGLADLLCAIDQFWLQQVTFRRPTPPPPFNPADIKRPR
ncbi:MAG: response regulator [Rhodocyclaceae bacterium]|nr:response regulator [Rhodocyclaceae bacterium]